MRHGGGGERTDPHRHHDEIDRVTTELLVDLGEDRGVPLDDARGENAFAEDEYMSRKRVRSLLCLPLLKQAELIGVLYLENSLVSHVFTPARIAVLKLLASQAAIALENARLFSDVAEREAKIRLSR